MRITRTLAVLACLAATLTACGTSESSNATGGSAGKDFIYITPEPMGGNPFLQLGEEATQKAAEQYDGSAKTFESTDEGSRTSNLDAAVGAKPDVIVLITFQFTDLAAQYAERYPDQEFVLVDACPEGNDAENLHCATFREQEASYLLGYEAGLLTTTNKVGSVVAVDIPFLHRYSDSFELGAEAANDQVTGSQLFIGGENPFTDVAKAKQLATQLATQGVDSVFAVGDYGGTFEAAKAKGFDAYAVDYNQCDKAPGHVADGTVKRLDVVVAAVAGQVFEGKAEPNMSFGLAEDGMGIVSLAPGAEDSGCRVLEHPDVIEQLGKIRQQIIDGGIVVPDPLAV